MHALSIGPPYTRANRPGWYVSLRLEGQQTIRMAGQTEAEAEGKRQRALDMSARGYSLEIIDEEVFRRYTGARMTFKEAAPLYLDAAAGELKPNTIESHANGLVVLCRARWASKPLRAISRTDILRWKDHRSKMVSPATVNRSLALASVVLRWAIDRGYASDNPFRLIRRASEKGRARSMWLTAAECQALLAATSGSLHDFVLMAIHTGLRKGELFTLEWDSIDFENGRIHVEPEKAKSGRGRYVPMTPDVRALLRELHARRDTSTTSTSIILTSRRRPLNTKSLYRRWAKLRKRGVKGISSDRLKKVSAHILRHTYASQLAQAGLPLQRLALYLGHGSAYVTERYAHLSPNADDANIGLLLSKRLSGHHDQVRDREAHVLPGLASICTLSNPLSAAAKHSPEAA